jgi:hypothetical protein
VPVELRPIPPLPTLGLAKRHGGAMIQEAPAFRLGVAHPYLPWFCIIRLLVILAGMPKVALLIGIIITMILLSCIQ